MRTIPSSLFPVPLIFVLFRDGEAVSCLRQGDETRKGETEMDAQPRPSLKVCADIDDSIALVAIRHRRSFRGRAKRKTIPRSPFS